MPKLKLLAASAALALATLASPAAAAVPPEMAARVYAACAEGDVQRLVELEALGVPIPGHYTRPLLGVAAENGRIAVMEHLLARGADPNQFGKFSTALELAARAGQLDAARWLLDHGARVDLPGDDVPLVTAVRACRPEAARLLRERGADPVPRVDQELAAVAARGCTRLPELRSALTDPVPCDAVSRIRTLPFHAGETGIDGAYDELLAAGCAVVPCLVERINDPTPMRNPVQSPLRPAKFVVGDAALFVASDITGREFAESLPPEVRAKVPDEGIGAYYRYVAAPLHRGAIRADWRRWLAAHPRCR